MVDIVVGMVVDIVVDILDIAADTLNSVAGIRLVAALDLDIKELAGCVWHQMASAASSEHYNSGRNWPKLKRVVGNFDIEPSW